MALFGKNKKTEKVIKAEKVVKTPSVSKNTFIKKDLNAVILNPRVTEKGAVLAEVQNVYPFDVHKDANKKDVADAIKEIYKVTPVKVRILKIAYKTVRSRRTGQKGVKAGGKKAYVYLKKGDKIEFV